MPHGPSGEKQRVEAKDPHVKGRGPHKTHYHRKSSAPGGYSGKHFGTTRPRHRKRY